MYAISQIDHYREEAFALPVQEWTRMPDGSYEAKVHHVTARMFYGEWRGEPSYQFRIKDRGKDILFWHGPDVEQQFKAVERYHDAPPILSVPRDDGLFARWREFRLRNKPYCKRPGMDVLIIR